MPDLISIGAVNIDIIARVDRFPAIDEEVAVLDLDILHGGSAANVAVGVSRLGYSSGFVGITGTDRFGDMLIEELETEGVDISHLTRVHGTSGLVFAAVNPNGERMLYSSKGVSSSFDRSIIPVDYIKESKILHLTSIIADEAIDALGFASSIAHGSNTKTIFDPGMIFAEKGIHALNGILKNCHIVLPSQVEAFMLTGMKGKDAGKKLLEYGPDAVIITQGEKGCLFVTRDSIKKIPAMHTETVDTTGAGDSFAAGLISALLENKKLEDAVEFANFVASISITRRGARTTPFKEETVDSTS